jgi:hypothetical protein
VRAYDRKTGELRWSLETPKDHQCIVSPTVIACGGKDFLLYGRGGQMAAARLPEGTAVAVKDWKTVSGTMLTKRDERDVVFFSGSGDHVQWADKQTLGPAAARFSYDEAAGELKGQLLWGGVDGKNIVGNESVAIVYHDGRLYHHAGFILDTTTGKLFAGSPERRGPRAVPDTKSLLAVAGEHVYGLVDSNQGHFGGTPPPGLTGRLTAYTLDGKKAGEVVLTNAPVEGEKARQIASQNQFPVWGFSYGPTFTPAGNRLYVRSNDYLWCIGEK